MDTTSKGISPYAILKIIRAWQVRIQVRSMNLDGQAGTALTKVGAKLCAMTHKGSLGCCYCRASARGYAHWEMVNMSASSPLTTTRATTPFVTSADGMAFQLGDFHIGCISHTVSIERQTRCVQGPKVSGIGGVSQNLIRIFSEKSPIRWAL